MKPPTEYGINSRLYSQLNSSLYYKNNKEGAKFERSRTFYTLASCKDQSQLNTFRCNESFIYNVAKEFNISYLTKS